jgi:hypothetical protein
MKQEVVAFALDLEDVRREFVNGLPDIAVVLGVETKRLKTGEFVGDADVVKR